MIQSTVLGHLHRLSLILSVPLLECRQLACERDGRTLFQDLTLLAHGGELIQIEGPNGCGKTTLLRALVGLLPDYQGEVLWRGQGILGCRQGFLAQLLFIGHLPGVKQTLTPRENLSFLAKLNQGASSDAIDSALAKVGLYGYEEMPGHQLSAGQLRRVALSRLYLSKAPLWVLDEPFTAIDKEGIAHLETLFSEHVNGGGCIVFSTHQAPAMTNIKRIALADYAPGTMSGAGHEKNVATGK